MNTHPAPNDGRHLEDEEEFPFFSLKIRLPRFMDVLAFIAIGTGCGAFYQSYISGNYGVMAERVIKEERDLLRGQDNALQKSVLDQTNLNHRLSDEYLDLDLLEERARKILGYVHPQDILIKE